MIKVPPQAIEVEQSVLATCLLHPDSIIAIEDFLRASDFYRSSHQKIYEGILTLSQNEKSIDAVSIVNQLVEKGVLAECGGAEYIGSLLDVPISLKIEKSAQTIKEKAALRQTISICNDTMKACFNNGDPMEIIDNAQKGINNLDIGGDEKIIPVRELVLEAMDRHEKAQARKGRLSGYSTGFGLLDYKLCGWQKSNLYILAARPSMGKSSLMMSFDFSIPTAIFSLEMSNQELTDKLLAKYGRVNGQKFQSGMFSKEDWQKVSDAGNKVYGFPLFIDDSSALHYLEIRRRTRKYVKKYGVKMIMIDHLQLMRGDSAKNRDREIGSITAGLKALAKDLKMPVLLLSQLNRKLEERSNKRPKLSDLRDSGNIEQDADGVLFLYRDEVYNKKTKEPGVAELNIAKQRNGPTGTLKLAWLKDYATFENLAREV